MAESRRRTSERTRSSRGQTSLFDYLFVVRRHWLLAGTVFLLVTVAMLAWVLTQDPVYESFTTIRLHDGSGAESAIEELATFEKPSSLEAEMTVMMSTTVAEKAARDEKAHPTAIIFQKNGHRPLEVTLRSFQGGAPPGVLDVHTRTPDEGSESYELDIDASGTRATVRKAGDKGGVVIDGFKLGKPFVAHERTFTITHVAGEYTGRTFEIVLRSVEAAGAWIRSGTFVEEVSERTGIVSLGFRAPTPELAQGIATALGNAYLEHAGKLEQDHLQSVVAFLAGQVTKHGEKLEAIQAERQDFIQGSDAHQLAGAAKEARVQLTAATTLRAERQRALKALQWELDAWGRPASIGEKLALLGADTTDPMTLNVASEYATTQREIQILLAPGPNREKPESPVVRALQKKLEAAEQQLTERVKVVQAARTARLRRDMDDVRAEIRELDERVRGLEAELKRIPGIERTLAKFERRIEGQRELLQTLVSRHLEAEIAQQSVSEKKSHLDDAFLPGGRKSPRLFRMGLLGVAIGLILAFGAAILRDVANRTVRSPQDIEDDLKLEIYATIPHYRRMRRRHRRKLKRGLVMLEAPDSVVAEAYRSLRANIRFAGDTPIRALAITSASQSEGKTVTTLNLAIAMARGGASVIVIDSDLRRSNVHNQLEMPRAPGLVDVLVSELDFRAVIRDTEVDGLKVLTAGRKTDEPGALLDSDAFRALLDKLKEEFDQVLIDVPPVLAVADAASFFRQLDGVLILTRDQTTPIASVEGALEQVERLGGKVLGAIYNAYDPRGGSARKHGYYGYYGYGKGYGAYESRDD